MGSRTWHLTRNLQLGTHIRKTITFADAVGQGRVGTNVTVFTITGRVKVVGITPFCTTSLTKNGSATISLGVTSVPGAFIAATDPTLIDANEWWDSAVDANITAGVGDVLSAATPQAISENIVAQPLVDDITAGVIVFDVWYDQITDDGALA